MITINCTGPMVGSAPGILNTRNTIASIKKILAKTSTTPTQRHLFVIFNLYTDLSLE
jgi:hypothetical protein